MKVKSRLLILVIALVFVAFILALGHRTVDGKVERSLNLGGTMYCFNALRAGDLDLYVEYTGTGLVTILDREMIDDPDETYNTVRDVFEEEYDLIWLEPLGFNNAYTLTMRQEQAGELGIETISDLAAYVKDGGEINAGFDAEFIERPDGYPGLKEHYDFEISGRISQMDSGLMYRAARDGDVDVINAFATDGRIPAYDLIVLEDDRRFFPPYYAAPLVRKEVLAQNPGLEDVLNLPAGRISDEKMQELNYRADEMGVPPAIVAADFLDEEGLIGPEVEINCVLSRTIAVGSKDFTEQLILGEMMALLIERHGAREGL